jgi:hypothetical protein
MHSIKDNLINKTSSEKEEALFINLILIISSLATTFPPIRYVMKHYSFILILGIIMEDGKIINLTEYVFLG